MSNKHLFGAAGKALPPDTTNEAGGSAYAFSAAHALAQYAVTGTFHGTFYATDEEQLARVSALASASARFAVVFLSIRFCDLSNDAILFKL